MEGRIEHGKFSYTRVARYVVDDNEPAVERGRIELAGLRSRNPLNRRLSWQSLRGITEGCKRATFEALTESVHRPEEGHDYSYEVKLSRISTRLGLDDDGVTAALKGVRDAFAIFVRINDGNRRRLRVSYGIGHSVVQGIVVEWTRTEGPFEGEPYETYDFFDPHELQRIADEHREMKAYWRKRREAVQAGAPAPDEQKEDASEEGSDETDADG